MNWKSSVGFAAIFLLIMWSMTNQAHQERKEQYEEALKQMQADSLAALEKPDSLSNKPFALPQAVAAKPTPQLIAAPASDTENSPSEVFANSTPNAPNAAAMVDSTAENTAQPPRTIPPQQFTIENDHFIAVIDNKGAYIRSIQLKSLKDENGNNPEIILNGDDGALSLQLDKANFHGVLFDFDTTLAASIVVQDSFALALTWSDDENRKVIRTYGFTKDGYEISHTTRVHGFVPQMYTVEWNGGMRETEEFLDGEGWGISRFYFSEVVVNTGYSVQREIITDRTFFNKDQGHAKWAGLRRKYVAGIINFSGDSEASIMAEPLEYKKESPNDPGTFRLSLTDDFRNDGFSMQFTILPLYHNHVKTYGQEYEKIIFSGWSFLAADRWFPALCGIVLALLNFFYSIIPNYGVAIILLTLLFKFVTLPLTLKQQKQAQIMQVHKPAIDAIRAKHRSDPQKLNVEMMKYYKEAGVNPLAQMGGCFTMFLQFPIFISLFIVLGRALELRWAPFFGWINDLSLPDIITTAITIPYVMPFGLSILPFVMVITTYFQTKQTIVDPNQKFMVWMMPGMMFMFSNVMPSGLLVYWIISNVFSIVQFWIIKKNRPQLGIPDAKVIRASAKGKKR
jgi:YidC/Oxa1 family membrane protein insertase